MKFQKIRHKMASTKLRKDEETEESADKVVDGLNTLNTVNGQRFEGER